MAKKPLSGAPLNQLIAGEGGTSSNSNMRFVISEVNFKELSGKISDEELKDTIKLITELIRRFLLFSQLTDLEHRAKIWQLVSPEIDELYLALLLFGEADPSSKTIEELLRKRDLSKKIGKT